MRIKLILAAGKEEAMKGKNPFKPLSLTLLAGAVPEHDYELIDMLRTPEIDYNAEVDLVGISFRRSSEKTAFLVADNFREKGYSSGFGWPPGFS